MTPLVKNPSAIPGALGSIPGLGRSPWWRAWQPTPVFLPGEFHGQRSLGGVHEVTKSQTQLSNQVQHSITASKSGEILENGTDGVGGRKVIDCPGLPGAERYPRKQSFAF